MSGVNLACCCTAEGCANCNGSPDRFAFAISGISQCPNCIGGNTKFIMSAGTLNPTGITQPMVDIAGACWWFANTGITGTLEGYLGVNCGVRVEQTNVIDSLFSVVVESLGGNQYRATVAHELVPEVPWTRTSVDLFRSVRTFTGKPNCNAFTPFLNQWTVSNCDDPVIAPIAYGQGICTVTP